jgi:hypothetical protein
MLCSTGPLPSTKKHLAGTSRHPALVQSQCASPTRQGAHCRALSFAQTALATREVSSGPNHRWTKDSARVVADALAALDRGDEAAALRSSYGTVS